jgi:hypothetical protein
VSLIAGTGYAFFKAVDACNWIAAVFVAILSSFINFYFLRWFINHRASALIYIDVLNGIRKWMWKHSGEDENIKKIILSIDNKTRKDPPYSREYEFYKIIIILIVTDLVAVAYIVLTQFIFVPIWLRIIILIFIGKACLGGLICIMFLNDCFKVCIKKIIEKKEKEKKDCNS